ncbi:hypothetical protein BJV78DRAFT_1224090 [Lactifluus subvellereus]|nr:hypothetical protein BJV78DRAFT_1224090 [Lactifluus subvellereus]
MQCNVFRAILRTLSLQNLQMDRSRYRAPPIPRATSPRSPIIVVICKEKKRAGGANVCTPRHATHELPDAQTPSSFRKSTMSSMERQSSPSWGQRDGRRRETDTGKRNPFTRGAVLRFLFWKMAGGGEEGGSARLAVSGTVVDYAGSRRGRGRG